MRRLLTTLALLLPITLHAQENGMAWPDSTAPLTGRVVSAGECSLKLAGRPFKAAGSTGARDGAMAAFVCPIVTGHDTAALTVVLFPPEGNDQGVYRVIQPDSTLKNAFMMTPHPPVPSTGFLFISALVRDHKKGFMMSCWSSRSGTVTLSHEGSTLVATLDVTLERPSEASMALMALTTSSEQSGPDTESPAPPCGPDK